MKKTKIEFKGLKAKPPPQPTGPKDLAKAIFAVADKGLKKRRVSPALSADRPKKKQG